MAGKEQVAGKKAAAGERKATKSSGGLAKAVGKSSSKSEAKSVAGRAAKDAAGSAKKSGAKGTATIAKKSVAKGAAGVRGSKAAKPKVNAAAKSKRADKANAKAKGKQVGKAKGDAKGLRAAGVVAGFVGAGRWVRAHYRKPWFVALAVLLGLYVASSLFFLGHYLPGTKVNGIGVSMRSPQALARKVGEGVDDYRLEVTGDDLDLVVDGDKIKLAFDEDAFAEAARARCPGFLWPIQLAQPRDFEVAAGASFSKGVLRSLMNEAVDEANVGELQAQDAGITYDETAGTYVIVEERDGTAIDASRAMDAATRAVEALRPTVELGTREYQKPTLHAGNPYMELAVEEANKRADLSLDFDVQGTRVATADGELLRSWVSVGDGYAVTGDMERILDWTRGDLSRSIDTVGNLRIYTRPDDGKVVQVYDGTYGWNADGAGLAELIRDAIEQDESGTIEVPMRSEAARLVQGEQDWGSRYLDVDLTEQFVRFYDDGELTWASECVTGDMAEGNDTVIGVYTIEDKESPKTLIGLDYDEDGEPDYESDVVFWMPFYGGFGLHDALWRENFGAEAHKAGGSHGCVNLPYYAAEELYGFIRVGDVVVVHY